MRHLMTYPQDSRRTGPDGAPIPQTQGQVIRWPRIYDLIVRVVTRGNERAFRQWTAGKAALQQGEAVLDVGCGTGTMALVAKEKVGERGRVSGIDPSPSMIARARHKAARRGLALDLQPGVIEHLSFPDQSFDVALCILVLHHLPDDLKRKGLREIARVLRPGERLLVLDSNLHLLPSLGDAGFTPADTAPVPNLRGYEIAVWKRSPGAEHGHDAWNR